VNRLVSAIADSAYHSHPDYSHNINEWRPQRHKWIPKNMVVVLTVLDSLSSDRTNQVPTFTNSHPREIHTNTMLCQLVQGARAPKHISRNITRASRIVRFF
jgi:hypothetical protein